MVENYDSVTGAWSHCFCDGTQNFVETRNKQEIVQSSGTIIQWSTTVLHWEDYENCEEFLCISYLSIYNKIFIPAPIAIKEKC